jgi:hypothetical protein
VVASDLIAARCEQLSRHFSSCRHAWRNVLLRGENEKESCCTKMGCCAATRWIVAATDFVLQTPPKRFDKPHTRVVALAGNVVDMHVTLRS